MLARIALRPGKKQIGNSREHFSALRIAADGERMPDFVDENGSGGHRGQCFFF
jgi:hypothetical protein